MLETITSWIAALWKAIFAAAWELLNDLAISVADGVFTALATIIAAIPVPGFASAGLGTLFAALGAPTLFILSGIGLPSALGIIGSGYVFRLARKAATLFQW